MKMIKSRWDPFVSSSTTLSSEQPSISKTRVILLSFGLFFTFVTICCTASLAAFQAKWGIGISGLNGFLFFLLFLVLALLIFLLVVPLVFDRWDKWAGVNRWLSEPRAAWILLITGTMLSLLSAMMVIISPFTQQGCKNPDNDPYASKGDGFKRGLKQWCQTKKAAAVFLWLLFGVWAGCMIHYFVIQHRQRKESESSLSRFKASSETNNWKAISSIDELPGTSGTPFCKETEIPTRPALSPKKASFTVLGQNEREAGYSYGYSEYDDDGDDEGDLGHGPTRAVRFEPNDSPRRSIDAYGAFDGDGMGGQRTKARESPDSMVAMVGRDAGGIGRQSGAISRTMLLASGAPTYDDPYAKLKSTLAGSQHSPQPPNQYQYSAAHYSSRPWNSDQPTWVDQVL